MSVFYPSFFCSTKCYSWIGSTFLLSRIFWKDFYNQRKEGHGFLWNPPVEGTVNSMEQDLSLSSNWCPRIPYQLSNRSIPADTEPTFYFDDGPYQDFFLKENYVTSLSILHDKQTYALKNSSFNLFHIKFKNYNFWLSINNWKGCVALKSRKPWCGSIQIWSAIQ